MTHALGQALRLTGWEDVRREEPSQGAWMKSRVTMKNFLTESVDFSLMEVDVHGAEELANTSGKICC